MTGASVPQGEVKRFVESDAKCLSEKMSVHPN